MTEKKEAEKCAKLLQAIAEANRIRIIECLSDGAKTVTELHKMLGVAIVNVSHHLGVLRSEGLVHNEKDGRFVRYSLNPDYFHRNGSKTTHLNLGTCQIEFAKK